jgi:hypothetical protein
MKPDGTFEVRNLPPGTYEFIARPMPMSGPMPISGDRERGRAVLTVNGDDINDLTIAMTPGGSIRGRVITDEGIEPPFPRAGMNIFVQTVEPGAMIFAPPRSSVREDGTFEVMGIFDRVTLQASFAGPGVAESSRDWRFKALVVNGQDVTDTGIEPRSGNAVENVDIVFTRKVTRLSGKLLDDRNQQGQGWVILFPADESRWTMRSRYIRAARAGSDGTFQLSPVPYDDYLLVGVAAIESGQWEDPEVLRALKGVANRVMINEGETKVQDVKLVEWRP